MVFFDKTSTLLDIKNKRKNFSFNFIHNFGETSVFVNIFGRMSHSQNFRLKT